MLCYGFLIIMKCTLPPVAAAPDTFCQIAKPIYWAAADSRKTKEQADTHNRKWKRVCQKAAQ